MFRHLSHGITRHLSCGATGWGTAGAHGIHDPQSALGFPLMPLADRFILQKENMDTQAALGVLARLLHCKPSAPRRLPL